MILTSDPDDVKRLIRASGREVAVGVVRGAARVLELQALTKYLV